MVNTAWDIWIRVQSFRFSIQAGRFAWNILLGRNVSESAPCSGNSWVSRVSVMSIHDGFPAIIVGISLGSTNRSDEPLGYRQEEFCWLASFTAMLVHFSHNISKTNPALRSRQTPLRKKLLNSFSLAVMLGLTWVIVCILLITHDKTLNLILSIVFCLCNTTQGIQIFVLFTLRSILKSNPALLNPVNALHIGLHRRNFFLWKVKLPESTETYTPSNPDPVRPPHVIKAAKPCLRQLKDAGRCFA
ncbi:uncharacterized protein LOC130430679 [Triplophysa dalaica]|uniref:uncharacterized protein LOC130430679 n=1 Tax=Triplophysa dalaica TaxID=1582913 RepID=UPI0024DF8ECC|nr:uncharacterized protein LOC130430679 [Triplophysa dalaica]